MSHTGITAAVKRQTLSGDTAYELFTSSEPFPLHTFLDAWKAGNVKGDVGYIIAVVNAYQHMVLNCHDGRYKHIQRKM